MSHQTISMRPNDQGIHDLYLNEDGSLAMAFDADAVGQHTRQRTMAFKGEWFLNANVGVPWLQDIMGKSYDPALYESLVKSVVKKTDGVRKITSFSIKFNRVTRGVDASRISILTVYDEVVEL